MPKLINKITPYFELMRLHQPVGIFLLLWPCLISLNLANRGYFDPYLTAIFIFGSIIMRSAGCIINDLADKNFDKEVARTKDRPLASGKISKESAKKLLIGLLISAFGLACLLNDSAFFLCFLSVPLIIIYPFCKRFTYWPQLVLGFTFNLGALIAWAAVREEITFQAILLYFGFVFWTLGYDTVYAHQDKDDDLKLGLKSTAIKFAEKTPKYLNYFYTIAITFIVFAFGLSGVNRYFYALVSLPLIILFWQVNTIDVDNRANCARRFKANILVGGLIFIASFF
jgi:4-hydroxybenzoate polyprenyltransferase